MYILIFFIFGKKLADLNKTLPHHGIQKARLLLKTFLVIKTNNNAEYGNSLLPVHLAKSIPLTITPGACVGVC